VMDHRGIPNSITPHGYILRWVLWLSRSVERVIIKRNTINALIRRWAGSTDDDDDGSAADDSDGFVFRTVKVSSTTHPKNEQSTTLLVNKFQILPIELGVRSWIYFTPITVCL